MTDPFLLLVSVAAAIVDGGIEFARITIDADTRIDPE